MPAAARGGRSTKVSNRPHYPNSAVENWCNMGNRGSQWEVVGNYVPIWEYRWAIWAQDADVHAPFSTENRAVHKSVCENPGMSWDFAPPGRSGRDFVGAARPSRGSQSLLCWLAGRELSLLRRPAGRPGCDAQNGERFAGARTVILGAGAQAGGAGHHHQQDRCQARQAPAQALTARRRGAAFSRIGSQRQHRFHHTGGSQAGASPLAASQSGL